MRSGGFDVIIGNPPYVEYSKVRKDYAVRGYETETCGNLYALVMERVLNLLNKSGSAGLILPISFVCTQRMEALQNSILATCRFVWLSNYAERPSKLFVGAEVLLTIMLARVGRRNGSHIFTTGFTKWASDERQTLFHCTTYSPCKTKIKAYVIPKLSATVEASILDRIAAQNGKLSSYLRRASKFPIYYRIGGGRYWKIFTNFQPRFILNGKPSVSSRENYLYFENEIFRDAVISILSSSLFYWHFIVTTNCRDLNPSDLQEFPLNLERLSSKHLGALSDLCERLMADYKQKSQMKEKTSSLTGHIVYQEFYPRLSKPILDEIDCVLAKHYGFTDEELDFIINYDIKYRMGQDAEADNGE